MIKDALIGLIQATIGELIRLGLDPKYKEFNWKKVAASALISGLIGAIRKPRLGSM